ncbi:CU044_5270 family protein [Amycolatopsis sp. NPDC057786]|uniref:CU044_5270 family protein n=1 Tax=Amycolatopsis sp. NPDC057786 TaxID=3346250 RepID=UPI00366DACBE
MNDLQTLRSALAVDEPSQDVVDRSRHRLQNRIRGGRTSQRRTGWRIAGAGLAAAAAAAVAIAVMPAASVDGPPVQTVSGQEILLAAATAAERSPEGSGSYWHVKVAEADGAAASSAYEYWIKPDGQSWMRGAKTGGKVMPVGALTATPFSLVAVDLTLEQLRGLPTDPAALKAWIAEALERSDARTSAGKFTASDREQAGFQSLISLVSTLPATPEVRATAFRAIAGYPGVENLGAVPGGQGLSLPTGERLVVDPETGRVNGTSVFVTRDGAVSKVANPAGVKITAEWTDTLPE